MTQANKPASHEPTIFVSIASYRDRECQHTLKDLFEKAKNPKNIKVAVLWQIDKEADKDCFEIDVPFSENIIQQFVDYRDSKGVCWARNEILKCITNEQFVLQIDSHMRFERNWDEMLLDMFMMLKAHGVPKPLITQYAPGYDLSGKRDNRLYTNTLTFHEGCYRVEAVVYEGSVHSPIAGAYISGHFIFVESEAFKDVPYDPYQFYMGEEVSLSLRFWTHGYDIFHPHKIILYHLYNTQTSQTVSRPDFYKEIKQAANSDYMAKWRTNFLMNVVNHTPDNNRQDLKKFGLGSERSIHEFEMYAGICFKAQTQLPRAKAGIFFYKGKSDRPGKQVFEHIFKENAWQCEETVSGPGSTLANTQNLRYSLSFALEKLAVKSVLDLPCGDMNYMAALNWNEINYYGADIVPEIVEANRSRFRAEPKMQFIQLDAVKEPLPTVDLIICRDMLIHFPLMDIWRFLENLRRSNAQYVLMTHYLVEAFAYLPDFPALNSEISLGDFRPVNLTAEPFYLPEPLFTINENEYGKMLGLWRVNDIALYCDYFPREIAQLRQPVIEVVTRLIEQFEYAFSGMPEKRYDFLSAYQLPFEACNQRQLVNEDLKSVVHKYWLYEPRNMLFRLIYKCELEQLKEIAPFIEKGNFLYASLIARECLNFILAQKQKSPLNNII